MEDISSVASWIMAAMTNIWSFLSNSAGILGLFIIALYLLNHLYSSIRRFMGK